MTISKKPRYNLNLIVQETGLKADTIRAWERRYQLPVPARSEGGHRLYSDHDLSTIKWLVARQKEGMRISQAANYWEELISSGIDPLLDKHQPRQADTLVLIDENDDTLESLQQKWIEYCLEFDELHADQVLSLAFAQFPIETVFPAVILPSLNQMGQLWYQGDATVQQEHFMSEIAIKKIQTLITAAPNPVHAQRILVACPPEEQHTIVNLILTLFLKHRGWEVIYLGANVPLDQMSNAIMDIKPELIILNASRLSTAVNLLEVLNMLLDEQIPAAFGGWIFNNIPDLIEKMPGTYLGNDLLKAIPLLEGLATGQKPIVPSTPHPFHHQELVKELKRNRPEFDEVLRGKLSTTGSSFSIQDIYEANHNLIHDISAALTLGDISFLKFNLDWLSGLFSSRKFNTDYLISYLRSFSEAVDELLGSEANLIVNWLESSVEDIQ